MPGKLFSNLHNLPKCKDENITSAKKDPAGVFINEALLLQAASHSGPAFKCHHLRTAIV
jgi:hypothetical protein